jgi:hypothetical protein
VPQSVGDGVVLVEGEVTVQDWTGTTMTFMSPLLVRLDHGAGSVFYTTFHNEAQVTGDVAILLEQIVESL